MGAIKKTKETPVYPFSDIEKLKTQSRILGQKVDKLIDVIVNLHHIEDPESLRAALDGKIPKIRTHRTILKE